MKRIPVHKLQDRASIGLEVGHTANRGKKEELEALDIHRDDNYIFLLIEKGSGSIMVDFKDVELNKQDMYFVAPGQVHHRVRIGGGEAWFASVTPSLIPKDYTKIFESSLLLQRPCALDKPSFIQCRQIMQLLGAQYESDPNDDFYRPLTYALLNSFLCAVARAYLAPAAINASASRPLQITLKFRKALAEKFKIEKSPSFYAQFLNISEIYLNEAVKKITGFTVTYWIMSEVMLEARRLLCYSQLNVKEIAHQLGYEDHTYFSRLFKKVIKTTPLAFRISYLK